MNRGAALPSTRLNLRGSLPLWAGVVLFIAAVAANYWSMRETIRLTDQRKQHREALVAALLTLSELKDLETGQRGYLITGRDDYLTPYFQARQHLAQAYARMRESLRINPALDSAFWNGLDEAVNRRIELAEHNLQIRRRNDFTMPQLLPTLDQGRLAMDEIRQHFARIETEQRAAISGLETQLQQVQARGQWLMWLGSASALLLVGIAYGMFRREQRRRLQAESVLEATVMERTAELQQALARIDAFAGEQERSIESERRRLAREVHDQIGQLFTALRMTTRTWAKRWEGEADFQREFAVFDRLLDEGVNTARRITAELRPPMLDDLGLAAALEHYCGQALPPANLLWRIDIEDDERLAAAQATALFRIAQEALTNVIRHAQALNVEIRGHAEATEYRLAISDDGRGVREAPGFGVRGMQERARLAGGDCVLNAGAAGGTVVTVSLPLRLKA